MFRKVIVYVVLFTFLFAVNVGAASMERKSTDPSVFKTESNSTGEKGASQTEFNQVSAEMENLEFMMGQTIVGWCDDVSLGQKAADILSIIGWGAAWIGLFAVATAATGGLFPILLALTGVAFMSFQGPWSLNNMLQ